MRERVRLRMRVRGRESEIVRNRERVYLGFLFKGKRRIEQDSSRPNLIDF